MLDSVKFFVKKYMYLCKLKKKKCVVHKSIMVKEPQFIHWGDGVVLGEGTKLLCWSSYNSGKKTQKLNPNLTIGNNVHATRNFVVQCAGKISIGNDVLIASNVFVIDYNHGVNPCTKSYLDNDLNVSEVVIKDGAWIGNDVVILAGVSIGEKSIIGAGSVVTKSIPDFTIAVGNPAKVIKEWNDVKTSKE